MNIKEFSVALYTHEIEACKLFYVEVLGGKITFDSGWYVTVMLSDSMSISFIEPERAAADIVVGNITLNMLVENVDEVYKTIRDKVNIVYDLANQPWGDRSFRITDPAGNIVYIYMPAPPAEEYKDAIKKKASMQYQSLVPNIGVKSVDETVKFYSEVLGFKEIMSVPEDDKLIWAMVQAGQVNLMFQDQISLEDEYPELKGRGLQSVLSFYVKVKDKDSLYSKIRDTSYLAKEMNLTSYGEEEFAIRDNNGFILTIAEDKESGINYDNFFLPAEDYEESKKFYSETLGLQVKFEFAEQGMIAFCVGDEEPAIILKDKNKFPSVKPTIWIEVPDVKALYSKMLEKGIKFITEPFKIRTGWAVEFTDPAGNTLGFADYKQ